MSTEEKKQHVDYGRLKLVYYALLEGAMRYKEATWRMDVENYKTVLIEEADALIKSKNLTHSKQRKLEDRVKGMSLDMEQKLIRFNAEAYKELDYIKSQFSDKADTGFDNYSTGFGLIIEQFIDAKNTSDLLLLCSAYNKGLLDGLIEELHIANTGKYSDNPPEQLRASEIEKLSADE